jgi:hypothetical protein
MAVMILVRRIRPCFSFLLLLICGTGVGLGQAHAAKAEGRDSRPRGTELTTSHC